MDNIIISQFNPDCYRGIFIIYGNQGYYNYPKIVGYPEGYTIEGGGGLLLGYITKFKLELIRG